MARAPHRVQREWSAGELDGVIAMRKRDGSPSSQSGAASASTRRTGKDILGAQELGDVRRGRHRNTCSGGPCCSAPAVQQHRDVAEQSCFGEVVRYLERGESSRWSVRSRRVLRDDADRVLNGSSSNACGGRRASARASETSWRSPPLNARIALLQRRDFEPLYEFLDGGLVTRAVLKVLEEAPRVGKR